MALYRAMRGLFVRKYIEPGERFVSDLPPGRNWEPLDDEARAAVAARSGDQVARLAQLSRFDPAPRASGAVEIPAGWRELHQSKRRSLAMKLGGPNTISVADADRLIEQEIERRTTSAAA